MKTSVTSVICHLFTVSMVAFSRECNTSLLAWCYPTSAAPCKFCALCDSAWEKKVIRVRYQFHSYHPLTRKVRGVAFRDGACHLHSEFIIAFPLRPIISAISELHGVPLEEAMDIFYNSPLLPLIEEGTADLHCRSDHYLPKKYSKNTRRSRQHGRSAVPFRM